MNFDKKYLEIHPSAFPQPTICNTVRYFKCTGMHLQSGFSIFELLVYYTRIDVIVLLVSVLK